jgi:ABC-type nitrate/sulfonate/bicarbonate transport system ATPase subunit
MAQYVFTMNRVGKIVPPKRQILKDISLSFFPGAKIGLLGLNGSGKSTVLRIMAGIDKDIIGEATPMPNLSIGYLPQEPQLDPEKTVRQEVESGMGEVMEAQAKLEAVYAAYAEENADFDKLAEEQARLEAIIAASGADTEHQLDLAADALRLPAWDANIKNLSGGEKAPRRALQAAAVAPRHAAAGRADQPPRCRIGGVAGAVPHPLPRHRGRRDPRPLLPRQRRRMDPRTRPRPRHPLEGQLSSNGWSRRKRGWRPKPSRSTRT